jgi:hypothetical protein
MAKATTIPTTAWLVMRAGSLLVFGALVFGDMGCRAPEADGSSTDTDTSTDTDIDLLDCQRIDGDGQGDEPAWALRCGGTGTEFFTSLGVDSAGNALVAFGVHGGAPFAIGGFEVAPSGDSDFVVVEFNPEGEVVWLEQFIGGQLSGMIDCGDDVVLMGVVATESLDLGAGPLVEENWFFASLSGEDGSHRWTREVTMLAADAHMIAGEMVCDAQGNLAATGGFREGIDFGEGPLLSNDLYDGYIARFDPSGTLLWTRRFNSVGSSYPVGRAITTTSSGEIVIVAQANGTVDFGGGPIMPEGEGMVLAKLGPTGEHVWSAALGGPGLYYPRGIAAHPTDGLALVGVFYDSIILGDEEYTNVYPVSEQEWDEVTEYDGFVARLDDQGAPTWSTPIGSMYEDNMHTVEFEGNSMITSGTHEGMFRISEYQDDAVIWELELPTTSPQGPRMFHALVPGALIVGGGADPVPVDLGSGPLEGHGDFDIVIAKYGR